MKINLLLFHLKTKNMKIGSIVLYTFLIISSSLNSNQDNQEQIALIDKMDISKIITKVEVDSMDNIIDTISINKYKFDEKQKKRYEESIYFYSYQNVTVKSYFKSDDDLFYQVRSGDKHGLQTTFETQTNSKGIVETALQINHERPEVDTIMMYYSNIFHANGNIKQLTLEANDPEIGQMISTINYDINEKALNELMMMERDTFSHQIWEYSDGILVKGIYTTYKGDRSQSIWYYNQDENLIKEDIFKYNDSFFEKTSIIKHTYNASNEKIKTIKEWINSGGHKEYFKYIIN